MIGVIDVLKSPLITEKGTLVAESGQVVFKVDPRASKEQIRMAVEKLFDVKVSAVRTINYLGKKKRMGRRVAELGLALYLGVALVLFVEVRAPRLAAVRPALAGLLALRQAGRLSQYLPGEVLVLIDGHSCL